MRGRIFAGLFLCFLFFVAGGDAQSDGRFHSIAPGAEFSQATTEKPVWTLEFIRVRAENFGPAMGYLDDHWMRVRAEAKRQGAVLDYHRIQNAVLATPGHKVGDPGSIVLLTKYKSMRSMDDFQESQKLFDSMREPTGFQMGGVIKRRTAEDLFETLNTQVFVEEPDTSSGFKLIAKQ